MVTFGGIGALMAGQLAGNHGWPVLAALLAGGMVAAPFGVLIGLLTIRLGDLYVALVTLTFGLLMETLVFSRQTFLNNGLGLTLNRPHFANGDRAFTYLGLVVFAIIGLFIVNLRRSTTGMALTAVRWSDPASKTIGISVLQMKVLVAGLAAFVAGIGGALWAMSLDVAQPSNYATLAGVIWLAVLVTQGIRSNTAALVAGLTFTLLPGVAQAYLPSWFGNVPPILFGLGAVAVAKNPDGVIAMQARQLRGVLERIRGRPAQDGAGIPPGLTAGVPR
jgi:branched-chain amino acid transport system permease protein